MGRNSLSLEIHHDNDGGAGNHNNVSVRDRLRLKRNPTDMRRSSLRSTRPPHHHVPPRSLNRKGFLLSLLKPRGTCLLYSLVAFAVCAFVASSLLLQSSITWQGSAKGGSVGRRIGLGSALKYVPGRVARRLIEGEGIDSLRSEILGNMRKDPRTLVLITVVKNLQKLGYVFQVFAVENGEARPLWEQLAGHVKVLVSGQLGYADWTVLMQEPFRSVPLIWIVHEDILANRLPVYQKMGQSSLVSHWRSAFARANAVVFPQFTLPMLHSVLDDGNFVVIPESVVDVWAAERYSETHAKQTLRESNGFGEDDLIIMVLGSSLFYDDFSWDNAVAVHMLGPLLTRYGRRKETGGPFKFIFLFGNSTNAVQEVASRLGLTQDTVQHFGLNEDVNRVLLMADVLVYASSQEEQSFPSLVVRAMSFGIPIVTPDFPIMKKYMADGVHGIFFRRNDPDTLLKAFSPLISDGSLSKFAQTVASSGRLLIKNMMATECITGYARLLENVLHFPSDTFLPGSVSQLQVAAWEWSLFRRVIEEAESLTQDSAYGSIVFQVEEKFTSVVESTNTVDNDTIVFSDELPSKLDWDVLEEIEKLESEELEDRSERDVEDWEEIYRNARKSEKLKFKVNERDEGELERTGQPLCIYEIYNGAGAWPFLHHGSLYRGLSLSSKDRRLSSDDVDAADRLPLLKDTYYRDLLCEIGGMFSVANKVDSIHMRPWIGFQSWRSAGRKVVSLAHSHILVLHPSSNFDTLLWRQVSLSSKAEGSLENIIQKDTKGEIVYFWTRLDIDADALGIKNALRSGLPRKLQAFRHMYGLPEHIEALPPMPEDGHHWSSLHNWVMPTPSFLEFVMFSRMFSESLDALHSDSKSCSLASSQLERKHCYCRVLELLVNVWAYHSGRKMVYINPRDGSLEEQHPLPQRKGFMWAKYFNFTLLKSMDEDLAEAADDNDHPRERWLWPLTGEVHWKGVYERERETKEKLYDRIKNGYKQKSLGG
ncbi:hypothetical protein Bca4012_047421 [Brassica carinata]